MVQPNINHYPQDNKDPDEPEHTARSRRLARHWLNEYEKSEKDITEWHRDAADYIRRYRDHRGKADRDVYAGRRRFNSLWGWFETVRPAVYGKTPQANVERRFVDHDPIGKTSSQILERALRNEFEINGFDQSIKRAVQDYLLAGRGQVWVRYEPEIEESTSIPPISYTDLKDSLGDIEPEDQDTEDNQTQEEEKLESTQEQLVRESAPLDYVHWRDFRTYPATARTWPEVQAVSKDLYLSEDECKKYFGEEIGEQLQALTESPQQQGANDLIRAMHQKIDDKRKVIEIWDKKTEKVIWVSEGYQYLCKEINDPLKLTGFFPCPEPLSSILTSDTLIPVPFFHEWKDQAEQIDELVQRINILTKACKVSGIYDGSIKGSLDRAMKESSENILVPVDGFADYGEKGLAGAVFFFPIEVIAEVLERLNQQLESQLKMLDLITGISDIMRGTSDARETMGAQRLKSNASSTRVDEQRKDVGRFVRDAVRLISEVIGKHFSETTLASASGIFYEEDVPNKIGLMFLDKLSTNIGEDEDQDDDQPETGNPPPPQLPPPNLAGSPSPAGGPPGPQPQAAMPPQGIAPGQPQPPPGSPGPMMGMPPQLAAKMALFAKAQKVAIKVKKAIDLLRDDIPRGYRIDIEIDSMVAGAVDQERQDSTEFITAITTFVKEAAPIVQTQPDIAPLLAKMLQWGVRKFRTGRDLEATIDDYADKIQKTSQQPKPQKPSPEEIKAQTEQARSQAEMAKAKMEAQSQQQNDQREQQIAQQQNAFEMQKMKLEMQKMEREEQLSLAEHRMKMEELQITHQQKLQQHSLNQMMPPQTQPM